MMPEPTRTRTALELFDRIAANHLRSRPGVTLERVFHNEGLKVHKKLYAFVSQERLVVKVPATTASRLSGEGLARPFEPRTGRKMKEWITLDPPATATDERRCQRLAGDAYRYVATHRTAAKPRKRR